MAIARAVVGDRHLLLADEPSGALDSVNGEAVMRLVRATCQGTVAGVVVTHDAQLASWADRVVFLRDGRIADQTAPPDAPESLLEADASSMTTTLAPPPPPVAPPRSRHRRVARRAISRWAWRLLRREWRQQLLVLVLIVVAVAATTVGLGLVVNVQPSDQAQLGTATTRVDIANPGRRSAPISRRRAAARHGRGDRAPERPGARIGHAGRSARAGPARPVRRGDAAPGIRPLPERCGASRDDLDGRVHLQPEDRRRLDGRTGGCCASSGSWRTRRT